MLSSMKMPDIVRYMYIVLVLLGKVDAFTCGYEKVTDKRIQVEGSFANITQIINVTDTSDVAVFFEMCRNNSLKSGCRFFWKSQSREMAVRNKSTGDAMLCFSQSLSRSQSTFTFELHASYLVERSLSMIKLSRASELLQIIRIVVTYPPQVTTLTVDEQEVSGTHLIKEGEEVKVACSFDEGNPPAAFRLVDKNGEILASGQPRLTYAFSAQCEDDWPRVYCEGNGSKLNRSVAFLIQCPLQIVDNFPVVSHTPAGIITFRVRAHTTVITECHLTLIPVDDNTTRSVNCALNGIPPDLVLKVYFEEVNIIRKGSWIVTVRNDKGSTNATFVIETNHKSSVNHVNGSNDRLAIGKRFFCLRKSCTQCLFNTLCGKFSSRRGGCHCSSISQSANRVLGATDMYAESCYDDSPMDCMLKSHCAEDSPKMACRMQTKSPIQLNFTFPDNGCRSDLILYYHPAVGQQRSIFACNWDERKESYDCGTFEPGVDWHRTDSNHSIIKLPENFEKKPEYFRYEITCYGTLQENTCSWDPIEKATTDQTMQAEAVSSTIPMPNILSSPEGAALLAVTLIFILISLISTFLLYKKMKELDKKLQHITKNKENENRAESESNATLRTKVESMVSKMPEPDTDMDTDVKNQSLESDPGEDILKKKENKSRSESEIEPDPSVPLLPNKREQRYATKNQLELAYKNLNTPNCTEQGDQLPKPDTL